MEHKKFLKVAVPLVLALSLIGLFSLSQGLEYDISEISKDDWETHPSEIDQDEDAKSFNNLSRWEGYNREKKAEVEIDQNKMKIRVKEIGANGCSRHIHLRNYSLNKEVLTINTMTRTYDRDNLIERLKRKLPGKTPIRCTLQFVYPEAQISIDINQFEKKPETLIVNGEKFTLN